MRKAKTPPKRKPVLTGRRAAKRKVAKGSAAKVAKVAKPGNRAKPAPRSASNAGKSSAKPAKTSLKAAGSKAAPPAKAPVRPAVKAAAVAKPAPAGQRTGRESKDSRKVTQAERAADRQAAGLAGGTARADGAGEKPAEAAAPVGLPTPIASFTI